MTRRSPAQSRRGGGGTATPRRPSQLAPTNFAGALDEGSTYRSAASRRPLTAATSTATRHRRRRPGRRRIGRTAGPGAAARNSHFLAVGGASPRGRGACTADRGRRRRPAWLAADRRQRAGQVTATSARTWSRTRAFIGQQVGADDVPAGQRVPRLATCSRRLAPAPAHPGRRNCRLRQHGDVPASASRRRRSDRSRRSSTYHAAILVMPTQASRLPAGLRQHGQVARYGSPVPRRPGAIPDGYLPVSDQCLSRAAGGRAAPDQPDIARSGRRRLRARRRSPSRFAGAGRAVGRVWPLAR